jgi:hypothetical protein
VKKQKQQNYSSSDFEVENIRKASFDVLLSRVLSILESHTTLESTHTASKQVSNNEVEQQA